jgi:hypothetical protein
VRVLPFDLPLATRYATVRASLERKGRPKTDFVLVVACTALEHGATLITNDAGLKDGAIESLRVADGLDVVATLGANRGTRDTGARVGIVEAAGPAGNHEVWAKPAREK